MRTINPTVSIGLQMTPDPIQESKEWHQTLAPSVRNALFQKLLAIFPKLTPEIMEDKRMINLMAYARKVESHIYQTANSRFEYYFLFTKKIYVIQKELNEKRKKRKEQQSGFQRLPLTIPSSSSTSHQSQISCTEPQIQLVQRSAMEPLLIRRLNRSLKANSAIGHDGSVSTIMVPTTPTNSLPLPVTQASLD